MPISHQNPILGPEWVNNATRILGIPLYPLGEVQAIDNILEFTDDRALMQKRLFGFNSQVAFMIILGWIFAQNAYLSVKMMIGIGISLVCCSAIILQKAYLILCKPAWVLIVGVLCILPQVGYPLFVAAVMRFTLIDQQGCVALYPPSFPWYWFGAVVPINVLFSSIFSYIAYKQYRTFGSQAWKRLAQEGIRAMSLVIMSNIFCGVFIFLEIGDALSEFFSLLIVLVRHCSNMRNIGSLQNRPRTKHMHLSQIVTAKTIQCSP
ncbi:hypothetical protein BDF19DRAFT_462252 [Syncephalis fuscata]|nr:hypothetical protein BDF19DRAFT_462252 [Syncephalis fuscata]